MIIHDLRKLGWKISIRHFRNINTNAKRNSEMVLRDTFNFRDSEFKGNIHNGGKTIVYIKPPGNGSLEFAGEANCDFRDSFNYSLGARIAFGRALKAANIL